MDYNIEWKVRGNFSELISDVETEAAALDHLEQNLRDNPVEIFEAFDIDVIKITKVN